ncbi:FtsK/SpoIIIE domain-containing protein [Luteococcus sp. H138]|uniref:FtsK/SpoIIIE domain-containing protein n=1 Tax=unclassified Luteococcus TaxID=2639923 RepID=UPI00313CB72D
MSVVVESSAARGTVLAQAARTVAAGVRAMWTVLARFLGAVWVTRRWGRACIAGMLLGVAVSWPNHMGLIEAAAVAVYLLPVVVGMVWSLVDPFGFEKRIAGPWRRRQWRRWARKNWDHLARECGLSVQRTRTVKVSRKVRVGDHTEYVREPKEVSHWVAPYLSRVETHGDKLTLRIRARVGQTLDEVEAAAPKLQVAAAAQSSRCVQVSSCEVLVELMMGNALATGREATLLTRQEIVAVGRVPAGRAQDGSIWWLPVAGRHTLVAGCSGSGKGSVLWSVVGNLAPAVPTGEVQVWGIDLKRGIELAMGKQLFSCMATTPTQAAEVLKKLLAVIDERGPRMAGQVREHTPRPSDPLHVLVIDELAVLTSYGPPEVVKEANRLLAEILTQGRALGVVVLACVQDPRKEVVGMRGLFTQTIALRQMGATETRLVLGDGTAQTCPAHRIPVSQQGTGWVQDETGAFDQVRADYWPDALIRSTARRYPSPVTVALPTPQQVKEDTLLPASGHPGGAAQEPATGQAGERKPRKPRAPRKPRTTTHHAEEDLAA